MLKNGQLGTVDKSLAQANKLYKDDSVRRAPLLGEQNFLSFKIHTIKKLLLREDAY